MAAVEEPRLKDVHSKEAPRGPEEELGHARLPPPAKGFRRSPLGIAVELLQVLRKRPKRVVEQRRLQSRRRALGLDVGMDSPVRIARGPAPDEPHDLVGRPAGMQNHPVDENVLPADEIVVRPGTPLEQRHDLRGELLGHALVGVDDQDPGICGAVDRPVLLSRRAEVLVLENIDAGNRASDLHRLVRRKGIDEKDLIGPGETLETLLDVDLFVVRSDDRGDPGAFGRQSTLT